MTLGLAVSTTAVVCCRSRWEVMNVRCTSGKGSSSDLARRVAAMTKCGKRRIEDNEERGKCRGGEEVDNFLSARPLTNNVLTLYTRNTLSVNHITNALTFYTWNMLSVNHTTKQRVNHITKFLNILYTEHA